MSKDCSTRSNAQARALLKRRLGTTALERNQEGDKVVISYSIERPVQQRERRLSTSSGSQIKEHMEVKGSDGKHIGTVLGVENGRLKLASGGIEHVIEIDMVDTIDDDAVRLRKSAAETIRTWH